MAGTVKDEIDFQHWLKTVEFPTLSLTEIAKRWAVLENNGDAAQSYLKEIARHLTRQVMINRPSMSRYFSSNNLVSKEDKSTWEAKRDLWRALDEKMDLLSTIATQGGFEDGAKIRFSQSSFRILMDEYRPDIPVGLFPPRPKPPLEKDVDNSTLPDAKTRYSTRSPANPIDKDNNCLPNRPTKRVDDTFLFIEEAVRIFFAEHKRCPNVMEVWSLMWERPPDSYEVSQKNDRGEDAISIGGKILSRSAFHKRWNRYVTTNKTQ